MYFHTKKTNAQLLTNHSFPTHHSFIQKVSISIGKVWSTPLTELGHFLPKVNSSFGEEKDIELAQCNLEKPTTTFLMLHAYTEEALTDKIQETSFFI